VGAYYARIRQPWNVVVTARPRGVAEALASLRAIGEFRTSPYAGVLIGSIAASDRVAVIADAYRAQPHIFDQVVRIIPLESTFAFVRDDVTETLCVALQDTARRIAGKSFYVRVRLRGLKGRVEAQAVERALGSFLVQRTDEMGRAATVAFDDPDVVVAAEVIGRRVGYALLDRAALELPLIRPK